MKSVTCVMAVAVSIGCLITNPVWSQNQNSRARNATERNSAAKQLPQPTSEVEYKKVGDKSLKLYVFSPENAKSDKRPAVIFFFGGGWANGTPEQFYPQSAELAKRGVVCYCAEYRVSSRDQAKVVDCIADAQDAVRFLFEHADEQHLDPQRIAAAGGSAGGHLAAATALLPYRGSQSTTNDKAKPCALILFNPALVLAAADDISVGARDSLRTEQLEKRFGDKPEGVSPYHHLSKALPPTLILHGKADTTVPYATVEGFEKKAKSLGTDCTLIGYEDQKHGFFNYGRNQEQYDATVKAMIEFLTKQKFIEK